MNLPNLLNHHIPRPFLLPLPSTSTSYKLPFIKYPKICKVVCRHSNYSQSSVGQHNYFLEEEPVIGDCVVFEEGVFEDTYLHSKTKHKSPISGSSNKKKFNEVEPQNLVPDEWREVQAELNINKKEKRKIAQELEFGRRVEKKKQGYAPLRSLNLEEYKAYREAKLAQLKPVVLDNPSSFPVKEDQKEHAPGEIRENERVTPKNPRKTVWGRGLEDVTEFFNSGNYEPGDRSLEGPRKLFTKEEKVLLNKRVPDLTAASSEKWLPLHALVASGEFYLVNSLLKFDVEINSTDKDNLTALHKAVIK